MNIRGAVASALLVALLSVASYSSPIEIKNLANTDLQERLARIFLLTVFERMETKSFSIVTPLFPVLPKLPDPATIPNRLINLSKESPIGGFINGTINACNMKLSGTQFISDDLSFRLSIPTGVSFKLDVSQIKLEGNQDMKLDLLGGRLKLTSNGKFTLEVKGFDLDLDLDVFIYPTGRFDLRKANLNLNFQSLHIQTENAFVGDKPFDWAIINDNIKEGFDVQWPNFKPQVDDLIKNVGKQMTESCNIFSLANKDFSCIVRPGSANLADDISGMIADEVSQLAEIIQDEKLVCPVPEPTPEPEEEYLLFSDRITDFGNWADSTHHCPRGDIVQGFQIKTEPDQGPRDDTAMNALRLYCGPNESSTFVHSDEGSFGNYGKTFFCPNNGYVNGFQMRLEAGGKVDNTAANNIRVYCSTNALVPIDGDGGSWGDWRKIHKCHPGYGVCGLKTQVEGDRGFFRDDTALNNLAFLCCRRPKNN